MSASKSKYSKRRGAPVKRYWRLSVFQWVLVIGVVAVVALIIAAESNSGANEPTGFTVSSGGRQMIDFPVVMYQGQDGVAVEQNTRFNEMLGDVPIVLNFWASNCVPCSEEMPGFQKVSQKFIGDVKFFGLDVGRFAGYGEPARSIQELRDLGVTYSAGTVPDIATAGSLEVLGFPSTFFISPSGEILEKWAGALSESGLTKKVEQLIQES